MSADYQVSQHQIEKLRAKVHSELVKERQIRGGGMSAYIPHQVYSRVLTDAVGFRWSWTQIHESVVQIPEKKSGNEVAHVKVTGRLSVAGLGDWDASGVVRLEDEESWKKADTAAFRKACDRAGICYQTWDNGQLYDEDFGDDPSVPESKADGPPVIEYSQEQKRKMGDIKDTYKVDNVQLLLLVKAWNSEYEGIPKPGIINEFIAWVYDHPDLCELALGVKIQ
jgi:hypothetical protein